MSTLSWGMIGGGEGSQIGPAHRMAAQLDGFFTLRAGALDLDPTQGKLYARSLGVSTERSYGDWHEMLEAESARDDRLDLVTIATPNSSHCQIAVAFLEAGFNVLVEKPMAMNSAEAKQMLASAEQHQRLCVVNFGYSGYPLVRHMRAMIERGDLGEVRIIHSEFSHGFHANAEDSHNPRVRWRYDPLQAGISAVLNDCGIHALHLACFVSGQKPSKVSADFVSCVGDRELEDDAMLSLRFTNGAVGRLWASAVAVGRMHGLTIQVFGSKGGLRWAQEWPNQLYWTPLGEPTQILERGAPGLSADAERASRVTIGHAEGMPLAFANIYADLAEVITADAEGREPDPAATHCPNAYDGLLSIAAVEAAVESSANGSIWVNIGASIDSQA